MKNLRDLSAIGWQAISRLGIALAVAWLVGAIVGRPALVVALVLLGYACIQIWNFLRLDYWLRNRRVEPPPDISGPWGELVAVVSRIYRRKQYHKARVTTLLREFRRLTTAMPEGAVLLGPEHEILWFNQHASEWLNLRRKRDFGIRIENLVRHPDFVGYMSSDDTSRGVVVEDMGGSGRSLAFHVVRAGGESDRQLLIVRDVSREVQVESLRRDFVANASHELRSPLTVISGYLDSLADDEKLDPTWNTPVLEMRRQAERMSGIINDLLELSKLESSGRVLDEQPVDIGGMLAMMRKEMLASERGPRHVELRIESEDLLLGVESELQSVVSNLVSNAVKYTPAEGEIEMRWWVDDEGGHLSIRDTGVGIAPEHIPRLTERFYRVDEGRARSMGGSGLGLAIVKHALQRHDATLDVQSREGKGSTFTCDFAKSRVIPREQAAHVAG